MFCSVSRLLMAFVRDSSTPLWKGLLYAFTLLLTALVQTMLMSQYNFRMNLVGMRIRTALIAAIYRKVGQRSGSHIFHVRTHLSRVKSPYASPKMCYITHYFWQCTPDIQ